MFRRWVRNDSNYEGLILAHQYRHGLVGYEPAGFISVEREYRRASAALTEAQRIVLEFAGQVLAATFADEREWFCPRGAFSGGQLLRLVRWFVQDKILCANERWPADERREESWWLSFARIAADVPEDARALEPELGRLSDYTDFDLFGMKRGIMQDFRSEIDELERVLRMP